MALYDNLKNLIAGATLFADTPLGTINAFGGSVAPDGWLMCQGQALSRTTYAELFAVIGTAFGAGDGSTTFNIPDFRGEFLRGAGTNSHTSEGDGGAVGEHQNASRHLALGSTTVGDPVTTGGISAPAPWNWGANADNFSGDKPEGESKAIVVPQSFTINTAAQYVGKHTYYKSRPTNTSVNFIIKAKQVGIPQDLLTQFEELLDSKQLLSWGNGT